MNQDTNNNRKNSRLVYVDDYDQLSVSTPDGIKTYPCIPKYLASTKRLMERVLDIHPRTIVIRVDIHYPDYFFESDKPNYSSKSKITRFISSIKSKVEAQINKRRREGKRVHHSYVNYIWVREVGTNGKPHYHVALFFNNDTFRSLGSKSMPESSSRLVNIIVEAWASALNESFERAWNLVHVPKNATYHLTNSNRSEYDECYKRLSYFAKRRTKEFGGRSNNFGCSRVGRR